MHQVLQMSLCEASQAVREGRISAVELTRASLAQIEADEARLGAYVRLTPELALSAARQADREIAAGQWRGALHGVPVAVKDLYDMAGLPTTCSSRVRHDHVAGSDSACVERLQDAGAIIVGKTHTHEFAYGVMTPDTGNPWDTSLIPGGSSGGSAATLAARGCFMAMGTDTGGSIRIPAAVCGVVGLKPTYGRVSRRGIASLSWSLDHAGPLARRVADVAATLAVLAGYDPRDPGSADVAVGNPMGELEAGVKGLRLGIPENFFFDRLDADVERNVRDAIAHLQAEGATLVPVKVPLCDRIMATEFGLCMPEASAYHHRMMRERSELYQDDVLTFLQVGALLPATDFVAAQRNRALMQAAWRTMFEPIDALLAPTVPLPATERSRLTWSWPDQVEEPVSAAFIRLCAPANLMGLPALALPCGFTRQGLPTSLQVIGRPFAESRVLRIGRAYERGFDWASRLPPADATRESSAVSA